ncbi:uncharacterized protein LOC139928797 [Centroberyx gerrardi]|uniref:uncharacterized protein n=1 Tax=Centroberyx gerrardi TaxID=166262 RepID=UPI003AB04510
MSKIVLFIELLLVHSATQSPIEIQEDCNEDVSLPCPGINGTNFRAVTWYKFINQKQVGIVRKSGSRIQHFNFSRTARFGQDHSLFLPSLTPGDSGTYECGIGANVGGKNLNTKILLTVPDCVTQAYLTTVADKLNITDTSSCPMRVEELPVMWSIIGFLLIGLAKIVLSLITIGVVRAIRIKSSRQQQQRWRS